jgi:hypothetical protein
LTVKLNYSNEFIHDQVLANIRLMTLQFLNCEESIENYDIEEVQVAYHFLETQLEKSSALRDTFSVDKAVTPFINIGRQLDAATLEAPPQNPEMSDLQLAVAYNHDIMSMCYGVVNKMLEIKENDAYYEQHPDS